MTLQYEIVIDCADPTALGRFWAAALGYVESPVPEGYESWEQFDREHDVQPNVGWECVDPKGRRPNLFFQRVADPKVVKNRIHLDLKVTDVAGEVERLTGLGATVFRVVEDEDGGGWTVMKDPEGNEFCVAPAG